MQARELVPVMGEQRGKLLFTGYAPRDLQLAAHLLRGVEKRDVMTACGGGECEHDARSTRARNRDALHLDGRR